MSSPSGLRGAPQELRVYRAAELAEATGGFSDACLIGQGGFGKVYRAMVSLTPVAIKVLDHEGLQGLREMHTEMTLLAGLHHPHIVRLLGYASEGGASAKQQPGSSSQYNNSAASGGGAGGCDALVYELMTGGNLEDRLARVGGTAPLPWAVRVRVAAQAAGALAFLHAKGIVHRDIKPANVFLDSSCTAKLGDIGLAAMDGLQRGWLQSQQQHTTCTADGRDGWGLMAPSPAAGDEAIGTWQYMAPEYKVQGRSSMRTDAYAFGLTLLQLVSGAPRPRELVRRAQAALEDCTLGTGFLDPSAGTWDVRVGERLVKHALWCCMHDPEQRPHVGMVAADLAKLVGELAARVLLPASANGGAGEGA